MDQNYTPQMPMVTPTPPPTAGPAPAPFPAPAPGPEGGTIGGDILQQNQNPTPAAKKSKLPIIIIIIVVLVLAGAGVGVFFLLQNNSGNGGGKNGKDFVAIANNLTDKISKSGVNKGIYLYDDLKELDSDFGKSPYGTDILKSAYIYYEGDDAKICMSDGAHRVSNLDGELKDEETTTDCNFKVTEAAAKKFLENYYKTQQNLEIQAGKTEVINSYYLINTDQGGIYSTIAYKSGKLTVTDDQEYNNKVDTVEKLVEAIKFYTENVEKMQVGNNNEIVEVKINTTTDDFRYVMIQSSMNYGASLKYADKLGKYLANKRVVNRKIGVRALVWDNSGIHNSYLIRISVDKDKYEVDTLENHEGEQQN